MIMVKVKSYAQVRTTYLEGARSGSRKLHLHAGHAGGAAVKLG
jgi:hypothetical protein